MSTRTLIEINHDLLHELKRNPEFVAEFIANLGSSFYCGRLNESNGKGQPMHVGRGIQIILQRHHSTDVTVTTEYQTVKL